MVEQMVQETMKRMSEVLSPTPTHVGKGNPSPLWTLGRLGSWASHWRDIAPIRSVHAYLPVSSGWMQALDWIKIQSLALTPKMAPL